MRSVKAKHPPIGYSYVHSAVVAHSRLAYSEVLADEQGTTAAEFWTRAQAFFAIHGITIERVLTDKRPLLPAPTASIRPWERPDTASSAPTGRRPTAKSTLQPHPARRRDLHPSLELRRSMHPALTAVASTSTAITDPTPPAHPYGASSIYLGTTSRLTGPVLTARGATRLQDCVLSDPRMDANYQMTRIESRSRAARSSSPSILTADSRHNSRLVPHTGKVSASPVMTAAASSTP